MQIGDDVQLAYTHPNQQYGLAKSANEVVLVIEAYKALRDRGVGGEGWGTAGGGGEGGVGGGGEGGRDEEDSDLQELVMSFSGLEEKVLEQYTFAKFISMSLG
ncbi:hypothetical protein HYC85_020101 [Camellia sinensis]|uniref:DUF3700 domain-containing protein n=1 Tax=Camellia sinensis TaxID=4442 RepID=A0A7J7GNT8_CAMSI|nr:hypothetical protein HYC85_020101 [Camellia sinensis]